MATRRLAQRPRKVWPWFWSTCVRAEPPASLRLRSTWCISSSLKVPRRRHPTFYRFASISGTDCIAGNEGPVIKTRLELIFPGPSSGTAHPQPALGVGAPSRGPNCLCSGGSWMPCGASIPSPRQAPMTGPVGFRARGLVPLGNSRALFPPRPPSPPLHPCTPWSPVELRGLGGCLHMAWQPGGVNAVFGEEGPRADLWNPLCRGHRRARGKNDWTFRTSHEAQVSLLRRTSASHRAAWESWGAEASGGRAAGSLKQCQAARGHACLSEKGGWADVAPPPRPGCPAGHLAPPLAHGHARPRPRGCEGGAVAACTRAPPSRGGRSSRAQVPAAANALPPGGISTRERLTQPESTRKYCFIGSIP